MPLSLSAWRERRTPLWLQVLGLVIASLLIAQAAALTVVFALPPEHSMYRLDEVASALRGGPLQTRLGRPLIRRVEATPPTHSGVGWLSPTMFRRDLARALEVKEADVRLQMYVPPPLIGLHRQMEARPGSPGDRPNDRSGDRPSDRPSDRTGDRAGAVQPSTGEHPLDDATPSSDPREFGGPPPPEGAGPEAFDGPGGWRGHGPPLRASFIASLRRPEGGWTTISPAPEPFPNAWQRRVIVWFLASFALIGPIGYLFARRLAAPLRRFADAADALGRDPRTPPMDLKGPAEIGLAAAAFNRMQARLQKYVEDRTAMVGAISHDLRTPLARIRFKVESASPELKRSVLQDVAQMEEMISQVLAFIRDASEPGVRERLDLRSLVECQVDEAALVGGDVSLTEDEPAADEDPLIVEADASSVQRVVSNLIDNALKYGARAQVRLRCEHGEALVEVSDEGPGLAPSELERVFLPFYRAEAARSLDTGGIGLGLSVSRSIARAHGGDVKLSNTPGGLVAQIRLPLAAAAPRG